MATRLSLWAMLVGGSMAACSGPGETQVPQAGSCVLPEDDVAWIRAMEEEHEAQVIRQDFDAMAEALADEILFLAPNQPEIRGKGPLREWQKAFEGVTWERYDLAVEEIVGCGDLAYVRMSVSMTFTLPGQTEPISDSSRAFHLLRKQPDGTWLVTHDFFHSVQPLSTG